MAVAKIKPDESPLAVSDAAFINLLGVVVKLVAVAIAGVSI
jgi:hypothetical protein